jgi:DNA processing protein
MDWNHCPRDDTLAWLRVSLIPLQPRALRALLDYAGSAQALLELGAEEIAPFAGEEVRRALCRGPDAARLDAAMRWLEHPNHHVVCPADPRYPPALLQLGDAPPVLYACGRLELLRANAFAIVGSRNATAQGLRDAESFARTLSKAGFAIVSGLAMGIDAAAHRGGLAQAGSSIAILGNGPDIVYPAANAALACALASRGCIVSEFSLGTPPLPGNFPRRNRLISGMSRGVLVVEAGIPSGSLNTAQLAGEQGREVFAVPGSIHSPLSKGCHRLIQHGAKLVQAAEDVLEELGCPREKRQETSDEPQAAVAACDPVLEALGFASATLEQLASRTGLDAASLAARMSMLELQGRVVALAGGSFQAVAR